MAADASRASGIVPFWQRFPRFFTYPLHLTPMVAMALGAGAFLIMDFVPFGQIVLPLIVIVSFVRYGYRILERTAHGVLSPEEPFKEGDDDAPYRPYKQVVVFIVFGAFTQLVASTLGEAPGVAVHLILSLAIPASVMVLAMTDSLLQAINPGMLLSVVRAIGWPYLLLNFCLTLLSGFSFIAFMFIGGVLPGVLALPVFIWLNLYFMLVMFNLMGYTLYQYHDRLGMDVHAGGSIADRAASEQDVIAGLIEENRIPEALEIAYEAQRRNPDDFEARDRYHRLLELSGDHDKVLRHAQGYIPALVNKRAARAIEVYNNARKLKPDFRLDVAGDQVEFARTATRAGHHKLAMQALLQFDRNYKNSSEIPAAWLLQAKILAERLKQDKVARQLLQLLISKYPQAPQLGEARQYLTALERIAQAPGA